MVHTGLSCVMVDLKLDSTKVENIISARRPKRPKYRYEFQDRKFLLDKNVIVCSLKMINAKYFFEK